MKHHKIGQYELLLASVDWVEVSHEFMALGRKIIGENVKTSDELRSEYFNFFGRRKRFLSLPRRVW